MYELALYVHFECLCLITVEDLAFKYFTSKSNWSIQTDLKTFS